MLQEIINRILYNILGLSMSPLSESVSFFIYDSIKILLLLFFMISFIGFLRTYISQEQIRKWLTGKKTILSNLMASVFGAITPFCSCSSIPIYLSFLEAGVPLGITFSFLITSPLVNEYLVILMWGFFGWKITLAYVISGILVGVLAGFTLGKMNLRKYLVKDLVSKKVSIKTKNYDKASKRILFGIREAVSITKKLWLWVLVGVGIGAIIHNYVPEELVHSIINQGGLFTVPLATLIGIPMYGGCTAIVPIAVVLFQKGVPLGTAMSFMMAVSALSLPEAIILRRAMKLKLISIFFGIVALAIILTGYLLNILQNVIL